MGRNGKSRALICFVLCMIMALPVYFSSAVAVKAAEQQTIIIGTNAEYSPFEYLDDNGNITGFDYDLLEAIAKEENVKLVWKDMYDFSEDSVLLVLASEHYDPEEYIRNYDEFVEIVNTKEK